MLAQVTCTNLTHSAEWQGEQKPRHEMAEHENKIVEKGCVKYGISNTGMGM